MKKLVLTFAIVMIAVGANAQTIIAEKDWSEMPVGWYDGCWWEDMPIVIEEGYLINSNPFPDANYWEPQVAVLGQIDKLEAGGQYQVKLTAEFPCGFAIGIILMVDIRLISEYRRLKKGD